MRIVRAVIATAVLAATLAAQSPQFEAASVKPNTGPPFGNTMWALRPSGVTIVNLPLRQILGQAFELESAVNRPQQTQFRLVGGPDGLLERRFDITTRAPGGTTSAQIPAMMRALLADRFRLRYHEETRQLPIYALTVRRPGQLGAKLTPFAYDCTALGADPTKIPDDVRTLCRGRGGFDAARPGVLDMQYAGPLSLFAIRAQGQVDRMLVDDTGLTGNYRWSVTYSMSPEGTAEHPAFMTAVEEQLGLKFEPRTGPVNVFVIDHIEAPTPD